MSAIRSSENRVEVSLRRALHALGLRYRKYRSDVPGRPDVVFPIEKVAVFVDGDYWHCRILAERGLKALEETLRTPTRVYWLEKFQRRVARDKMVTSQLRKNGWAVLRFWESDIKRNVQPAARRVAQVVRRRRAALPRR
jgi:DNA mismatch endonuclease (patch repair protein)